MTVAGVQLSNADRVLYPEQGLTKGDLAAYYEAIASWMLPHAGGRPLSLVRCPEGSRQSCFYQKHWSGTLPKGVETVEIKEASGTTRAYTVVHDATGLVALVQHGVLEFHLWGARADNVDAPDRIIFDLDPAPGVGWARVREAAKALRELLDSVGLASWIKTSGGKGLHVAVPIDRRSTWSEVSAFARAVAAHLARENPRRYIATASKAARTGLIFIDWLRNTRGATSIAPWSTRAREGAPISAPLSWDQLDDLKSGAQFRLENVLALVRGRGGDPWAPLLRARQRLTRAMTDGLAA